jgi:ketosteroid isomerase-like protein
MKSPTASAIFLVFLMLGALIAAGGSATAQCRPSANDSGQSSSTHDAKKGLDDFNRAFIEACRSMNHDAAGQLWADDGVDLLPGMEPMVGKAEISSWLKGLGEKMKGVKVLQCDVNWRGTNVAGDVAYEWGINTQTVSVPDRSEPLKNKGKITLILRKQVDGSWKLALESWNSSPQ